MLATPDPRALFGHLLLFPAVELRQFARKPGSFLALGQQVDGGLQGAAAIWIPSFTHPAIKVLHGLVVECHSDFSHHAVSMTIHPTRMQFADRSAIWQKKGAGLGICLPSRGRQ